MSILPKTASAAVAIIKSLAPCESFLILRRVAHPEDPWSGHFSFPGGRREAHDPDLLATCIRETREETGIILDAGQLRQRFPLEPAGLNFGSPLWVQPFLFTILDPPPLSLCRHEIQGAYWLEAQLFQNMDLHKNVEMIPGRFFPTYPLDDYYLWGFTYRLLQAVLQTNETQK